MNRIPGVVFYSRFFNFEQQKRLVQSSLKLYDKIIASQKDVKSTPAKTYVSRQHNLSSKESYKLVRIADDSFIRTAQHFETYGEKGHSLTYFIGNENIPYFITQAFINRLVAEESIQATGGDLNWKFTFNTYRSILKKRAGFPWHIDTPSNGDVTAIATLIAPTTFQLTKDKDSEAPDAEYQLTPGSVIILSDDARWNYWHRVVPQPSCQSTNEIERISLVLGCQLN